MVMTWAEIATKQYTDVQDDENFVALRDYLKTEEDDDRTVHECCCAAISYITAAVGEFDESDPTAVMLMFRMTQDYYDNRILKDSKSSNTQPYQQIAYMDQSVILQLQMKYALKHDAELAAASEVVGG